MDKPKFHINQVLKHAEGIVKVLEVKQDEANSMYLYKVMPIASDGNGNRVEGESYLATEIELEVGPYISEIDMKSVK